MHSQLTYAIAKQHQAELIPAAARARLIAQVKAGQPRSATAFNRFSARFTSVIAQTTFRTTRDTVGRQGMGRSALDPPQRASAPAGEAQ